MTGSVAGGRPPLQPQLARDQSSLAETVATLGRKLIDPGPATSIPSSLHGTGTSSPSNVSWLFDRGKLYLRGKLTLASGNTIVLKDTALPHHPDNGDYSPVVHLHDSTGLVKPAQITTTGGLVLLAAVGSSTVLILDGSFAMLVEEVT